MVRVDPAMPVLVELAGQMRVVVGMRGPRSRVALPEQNYDRYAPLVFPLIQRIVRERADASDVLQEVFWEAW